MATDLDTVLDRCISEMEDDVKQIHASNGQILRSKIKSDISSFAWNATTSNNGYLFADRVSAVIRTLQDHFPPEDLNCLQDFVARQQEMSWKMEETQVRMIACLRERVAEGLQVVEDNELTHDQPAVPDLSFSAELEQFSTSRRTLFSQDPDLSPLILQFDENTKSYWVSESGYQRVDGHCAGGAAETQRSRDTSRHIIPRRLNFAAWTLDSPFIRMETQDYLKDKDGKVARGEYYNLGMANLSEVARLLQHLQEMSVPVKEVSE
ncbi:MAG: hypothetical protein Q9181_007695 [Wetmoreana brouardii]